jgi:hypothetical protein
MNRQPVLLLEAQCAGGEIEQPGTGAFTADEANRVVQESRNRSTQARRVSA